MSHKLTAVKKYMISAGEEEGMASWEAEVCSDLGEIFSSFLGDVTVENEAGIIGSTRGI